MVCVMLIKLKGKHRPQKTAQENFPINSGIVIELELFDCKRRMGFKQGLFPKQSFCKISLDEEPLDHFVIKVIGAEIPSINKMGNCDYCPSSNQHQNGRQQESP